MYKEVEEFMNKYQLREDLFVFTRLEDMLNARGLRVQLIVEETNELIDAFAADDRTAAFDALLDLAWVTMGTAVSMGITPEQWQAGVEAVAKSNMQKVLVESADDSKRGNKRDVKKPEGWVGPESRLREILGAGHETL